MLAWYDHFLILVPQWQTYFETYPSTVSLLNIHHSLGLSLLVFQAFSQCLLFFNAVCLQKFIILL